MGEDKKEKKQAKKLSYEELEMAAQQIASQAEAMANENRQLKMALQQAELNNVYTELEFRFKVLQYPECFSPDFFNACVESIEKIMTPKKEEPVEEPREEEPSNEEEG